MVTLLFITLSTEPRTLTVMEQLPTGRLAFDQETDEAPATAVTLLPQLLVTLGDGETTRPAGRVSVKLESMTTVFGLEMAKVRVESVPTETGLVPKLLVMEGGARMLMLAVTVALSTVASAWPLPGKPPAVNVAVAVPEPELPGF